MNRTGVYRCLLAALFFGASAPATSLLTDHLSTLVLAGLLYLGAALAVLPSVVRSPPTRTALRLDARPTALAVLFGGAIGPALLVAGLSRTSAASASLLLNLELVATLVLAATVFREYLGRRVIIGAGLVTLGGVVLAWEPGASLNIGAVLIGAACLAWGIDNAITSTIDQLAPEHVVFLKGTVAGSANLFLGLLIGEGMSLGMVEVAVALAIGSVGYGLSITLWVKGARDLGAARGQVIFSAAPFIGVLIAWLLLGEPIEATQIVAITCVAAGIGLSLEAVHEHVHSHRPLTHEHEHRHDDEHHNAAHHGTPGHNAPDHGVSDHEAEVSETTIHTHRHQHLALAHSHSHVPDLHHRHDHMTDHVSD